MSDNQNKRIDIKSCVDLIPPQKLKKNAHLKKKENTSGKTNHDTTRAFI